MLRGTLGGILAGTALSGLVLGTASVLMPLPGAQAPEAVELEVPAGSAFDHSRDDTEATLPQLESAATPDSAPLIEAPQPDDLESLVDADTQPIGQPSTESTESVFVAPDASEEEAGILADGTDEPVLPAPQGLAPEAPETEQDLSVSTEPAQPIEPEPVEEVIEDAPAEEVVPEETAEPVEEQVPSEAVTEISTDAPEQPEAPTAEDATDAPVQPETPDSEIAAVAPEVFSNVTAPQQPEVESETSGVIGNLAEDVTVGRLTTIGEEAETSEPTPEADPAATDAMPALEQFAAEFENPEQKPLMAIVLIDDGSSPVGFEALADFPYPVSFAVDTAWSGATDAAARYRAAGFEVLALTDLSPEATATDTEVAMQTHLTTVPEAVAVMEGTGTGLQSNREASEQLIPILSESGHGLVLFPDGLNTVQKLIAREGVPALPVFRDFDAKGQNASAVRRFLDQAAFKASRGEQGVIMVGRLRAETISALLIWGLQDRSNRIALAPVSAILRASAQ